MQNRDLDSSGLAAKTSQCKGRGAEGRKAEIGLQAGRARSSEVTDKGDGTGMGAREPGYLAFVATQALSKGGGDRTSAPVTRESCVGFPAPRFIHLKTISLVVILGSWVTWGPPVHCPQRRKQWRTLWTGPQKSMGAQGRCLAQREDREGFLQAEVP